MIGLTSDGTANGTKLAEGRSIIGEEYLWASMGSTAGVPVTEKTALGLSSLLAVVVVLATDSAVLPFHVYKMREDGGRDPDTSHAVERLIAVTPDGETTPIRWRQAWMGHALQHGNGYAEIQRKGRGTPVALHLLDPAITRTTRRGGRLWYENGDNLIPKENILHIGGIGFDGLCGYNLIRMLSQPIGLTIAAETSACKFYENSAEPGGVIEHPRSFKTADAIKNITNSWNADHQGSHNRHKIRVLEEGASWKPMTTDPEKQQLIETRRFQAIDLSRPWRVPPHKLGDYSQSHLANIEASNLDYLMTALVPWLECIEQECNLKLFSESERKQGYFVEHNVNGLLRGDVAGRGKFYQILRDLGVLTPNLISKLENMNPIGPEGDIRLVPLNMISLDLAGQPQSDATTPTPKPSTASSATPVEPAPGDGVDLPLTGEQIFSIQRVLSDVVQGDLPAKTAAALLKAALPSLDDAEIDAMLAPIEDFQSSGPKIEAEIMTDAETRCRSEVRVRRNPDGKPVIFGYAAVFNAWSVDLGGFIERIQPGAFSRVIAERQDVRALISHDTSLVMGRTPRTLRLSEDETGLSFELDPPSGPFAAHYVEAIERGDMSGMSFRFVAKKDMWNYDANPVQRELLDVDIDEISLVAYPAYPDTSAAIRSLEAHRKIQPLRTSRRSRMARLLRLATVE